MYCPSCKTEYREGFSKCSDCDGALIPVLPPPHDRPQKRRPPITIVLPGATRPLLFVLLGIVIGTGLGLYGPRVYYRLRYPESRGPENVMKWAYTHVPAVVGTAPGTARMLDAVLTGNGARGEARLTYEEMGTIKVIETQYATSNGVVTSPTDEELRRLNQAARALDLRPERRENPASPN
jgi:hypothetical protein